VGCDIHPFWEVQDSDGRWHVIVNLQSTIGSSYDWFGLAAGVRIKSSDSLEPRGIPSDLSWTWEYICETWVKYLHNHSWLTPSEVKRVNEIWRKRITEDIDDVNDDYDPSAVLDFIEPLGPEFIISNFIIPDANGKLKDLAVEPVPLAQFVDGNIEERVRLVFAFDN